MLVPGVYYYYLNLVFRWLGLVVLFSSVVIGYVIRRKWRLAVARKEEIKRLLVLASEEAARAEHEASSGYYGATVSVARPFQCAVCYSPTTTRCARCKAARYCSGKCQIIHWRQGHKEECRPPTQNYQVIDEEINSKAKAATQDQFGTYDKHFETEDGHHVKPSEAVFEEHAFSNFSHSSEFSCEKNDDVKAEFVADETGTISSSSSSTIFSTGFTSSNITGESSDDASVSESIDSIDLEKLDGHRPSGVAPDALESANSVTASHTKPLSAEFSSSLAGGHSSAGSLELNQINSVYNDGESRHGSTNCLGLSTKEFTGCSVTKPLDASNDFWEGALDSRWSRKDAGDKSAKCISREASDNHLSDSGTSFFFNLSGNTIPPLHSKGSVVKSVVYDKAQTSSLGMNEANYGAALSNNIRIDAQEVKNPSSSCSERFDRKDDNSVTDSHVLRPKEVRNSISGASVTHLSCSVDRDSTRSDASNVTSISSLRSKSSNHVVNGTSGVSHMLKSGEDRSLSSSTCGGHSPSSNVVHSVASVKTGKVDGVQDITNSYQNGSYSPNGTNGLKTSIQKVVDQLKSSKLSKNCSIGVGSETVGRYSDKGLFRYELFIKLYSWNKVELLPCGLTNCGNSCYANVVLQCLAFTPPLTAYFLQGLHSKACVNKEWCFTCEFESLILKAKEGNSPLSPVGILSHLRNIGSHLGSGKEEDAHEFLRFVIDKMQSVFLKEAGVIASGSLKEETTLIGLTFGGYLRSKIKCLKCQGKSERHERIMDLTVEIEGDIGTLEEALKQFTRTEILDGENKYQCSRCKSYEKAKKKLKILEAPNVLTIALKRYQSGKFGKLSKSVEFPEILDLAKYMSGTSDKSPIYRLYGVVEHLDIRNAAFSGHYVCYVKNNQNKWFKIDDSLVKPMELRKVKEKGAYMLLYARCSPRAPRLLRNRISRDPKIKVAMPKSRFPPAVPSVTHSYPSLIPSDGLGPASYESFYSGNPMRTIFEADSSSDSSSLLSSCSDEGSCSTDSTRDSTSTDDLSDFIFGPWRNSSDSDTSSSSSPMYGRHSPLSDLDRYASGAHEPSGFRVNQSDSFLEGDGHRTRRPNGSSRLEDLASEENTSFLNSDMTKQCRKLGSSSSCRETDSERLGRVKLFDNVKFGVSCRSSTRERTN